MISDSCRYLLYIGDSSADFTENSVVVSHGLISIGNYLILSGLAWSSCPGGDGVAPAFSVF